MEYQLHRPKELGNPRSQVFSHMMAVAFPGAAVETAGPILFNGKVATFTEDQVDQLFDLGERFGARPCRRDPDTGFVHLGHFVFVPEDSDVDG